MSGDVDYDAVAKQILDVLDDAHLSLQDRLTILMACVSTHVGCETPEYQQDIVNWIVRGLRRSLEMH